MTITNHPLHRSGRALLTHRQFSTVVLRLIDHWLPRPLLAIAVAVAVFGINSAAVQLALLTGNHQMGVIVALRPAASAQVDNEKAVTVLQREAAAFEKSDVDALNKFWANDEWVSVFESGGADIGWANYRDHHLIPEMKELKNTKHTLSDIRVRVRENRLGHVQVHTRWQPEGAPH